MKKRLLLKVSSEQELFNLKWEAIMLTIWLKETYSISPREIVAGVDLLKKREGLNALPYLTRLATVQSLYNEEAEEKLTDEYLEEVSNWTQKEFYERREEDKKKRLS